MSITLRQPDYVGWKQSFLYQRDGMGFFTLHPAQVQFIHWDTYPRWYPEKQHFVPYQMLRMDEGRTILLGTVGNEPESEVTVITYSDDEGDTWTPLRRLTRFDSLRSGGAGRVYSLTDLGCGELMFISTLHGKSVYFFSHDYGQTWTEIALLPTVAPNVQIITEGNYLVDYDDSGKATFVAGFMTKRPQDWRHEPFLGGMISSRDRGRTWSEPVYPETWRVEEKYEGKTYTRGTCEGAMVRAANGAMVGAFRMNEPPHLQGSEFADNSCCVGVTLSKDNGKTWTQIKEILPPGCQHTHLLCLPDGRLVLSYVMRHDITREGKRLSYRRGCGAVISTDHGETWDTDHGYLLHTFDYSDGSAQSYCCGHVCSALLGDGSIVTSYMHSATTGACLVKWKPAPRK